MDHLGHDSRARGLVGKGLGHQSQAVEHVPCVRVPQRAVAQHQELGVQERSQQTGSASEHEDETQRSNANLREGYQAQQIRGLELHNGDGKACGPAGVLAKELKLRNV